MVDALVLLVQADGLDDEVVHAQLHQFPVQDVAKGSGFVTAMHRVGHGQLSFDPLQKFDGRELLRRLRCAVVQDADHHDGVGVDVQAQLEGLLLLLAACSTRTSEVLDFLLVISLVGVAPSALTRQQLMSFP